MNNRREFLGASAAALGAGLFPHVARAETGPRLKFAVMGINHEHIFRMVQAVRDGGGELAMIYDPDPDPTHGAKFLKENAQVPRAREEREVFENKGISLVVSDAMPAKRAQLCIRAMRAGKDVLADKGGFLNLEDLAEARRVQAETKRIYAISYNERLLLPVSLKIDELLAAGEIGRVFQMWGSGPHGLYGHGPREPWFWQRAARGGILADVGTHQADQFIHYVGAEEARVMQAEASNKETPDHPEFEDYGRVWFQSKGGTGDATLRFTKEKTAGFELHLHGTEGRMEVVKHAGKITVIRRDGAKREYVVPQKTCPWGRQIVDDVLNRTETANPQAHTFLASELAVRAQMMAVRGKGKVSNRE
ncbi:Gfo/Idh/MocA family protein [Prosthecobacter sp.]|uniref:Gfo/Idh/MocA family protein n=1 Tax=Prosthecobacter sp. TaxID=1965333 RepID=UPI0037840919